MNASDVKGKDKKHNLQAGLRVLYNVLINGKSEDPNQDITKSSSLPTLLIQLLKNIIKSELKVPDLLADLVKSIATLGKANFNKQLGIEPIVMKIFLPLLPMLAKDVTYPPLQVAALKALGVFASQASIIPIRMQSFYKDLID